MAKQLNVNLSFTANTQQAKAQLQSLKNTLLDLSNLQNGVTAGKKINDDLLTASRTASQLKIALEQATDVKTGKLNLTNFNKSLKDSNLSLAEARVQLNKLGSQGSQAFLGLAAAIQSADAPLLNMGAKLKTMVTTLANTARWQAASSAVHLLVGEIQSAYSYAQSLDKSLNNIRIVSGASADEMADFAKQANKSAQALSSTTKKYADAALIFYQQGLSDDLVKERTDATIKMANVTGEATDQVSSYMTAVWNNFNKDGAKSAEYFGDVMTKLGADTAASTEEIAGGLEKFASVADTIGLSFEYATSAITTIVDRTRQSEDVVGTALKTIFSRIQGLKQGETLDDGTDLNKYSQGLAAVGVQIKDAEGNLRDMDDILNDIGATWNNISRDQKVALAQTVAGVRQYSQFMALFDNWDFMQQNLDTTYGAEGTLDEQADIYAESWEAARKRVRAAAEGIFNDLIDKDFFVDIDDAIVGILNTIDKLINSIGGVKGVLLALGTVGIRVFQTQIAGALKSTATSVNDLYITARNKVIDLTGSSKERKKTSTERTREEAAKQVQIQADDLKKSGNYLDAKIYKEIGVLQQSFLANADKMSVAEQQITASLIDRQQAQGTIVTQTQEELTAQSEILDRVLQINRSRTRQTLTQNNDYQHLTTFIQQYQQLIQLMNEAKMAELSNDKSKEASNRQQAARTKVTTQLQNMGYQEITDDNPDGFEFVRKHDLDSYHQAIGQVQVDLQDMISGIRQTFRDNDSIVNFLNRLEDEIIETTDVFEKSGKAIEKFSISNRNAAEYIEQTRIKIAGWSENAVLLTSSISSIGLAVTSLSSAFSELSQMAEENRVTFSGVSNVFMSLSMGLPALVSGLSTLGKSYAGLAINLNRMTKASQQNILQNAIELQDNKKALKSITAKNLARKLSLTQEEAELVLQKVKNKENLVEILYNAGIIKSKESETAAREKNAIATAAEGAAQNKLNFSKIKDFALTIGKSIANFAAMFLKIGLITVAIVGLILVIKKVVDWWNKDANALKEAQEATKKAKEEFDNAKSAYDNLKSSIEDYNSALDAINKLTKGTTEWKQAIQEANEKVIDLLDSYPELSQYITRTQDGLLKISETGQNALLEAQNAKVQNTYRNYNRNRINLAEAENNNTITQFTRSVGGSVSDNDDEEKVIRGLLHEYQSEGESALTHTAQEIANQYGVTTDTVTTLIDNNLNSLIISLDANTSANDVLTDQIASSTLSQHLEGYDQSSYQDVLNSFLNFQSEQKSSEAKSYVDALNDEELFKAYAALTGIDSSQITKSWGKAKITDSEGNTTKMSKEDMRSALYGEAAQMQSMPEVESLSQELTILDEQVQEIFDTEKYGEDVANKLTTGLVSALSSNEETTIPDFVSKLTFEEYNAVKEALANGSLQESVDVLYANNKNYFTQLGFSNAQDFLNAFNSVAYDQEKAERQAEIEKKKNWQDSVDSLASELEVDSDAVEGYAGTLQDLYPQLEGNTEATLAMAKANIKFSKGFDSLVSAIDDNEEALKDLTSTSWLTQEALAEVGDAYEEMTGVHVSNDFIKDNLENIKKLADGDISVLEELGEAAARDYVAHLAIPQADIDNFQSVLDSLSQENLEIGANINLNDANYLSTLNDMLRAGTITVDQIQTAFNSIGYAPDIEYSDPIPGPETTTFVDVNAESLAGFLVNGRYTMKSSSLMTIPQINGASKISTPSSLGSSIHPSQTTSGKKKKDGGSDKKEMERYYTITRQIKTLEKEYDRLATARDRAWGKNATKLIDQEIIKTNQLIAKQKVYIDQIEKNLAKDRGNLKQYGAKFDDDGVITNYRTMFKKYGQTDDFEELVNQYSETLELWQERQTQLQEDLNQLQDLTFESITQKIEYKIEINESDKKIAETFFDLLSDDVYKSAEALEFLNQQVENNKSTGKLYQKEYEKLAAAWKAGSISQADYLQGLEDVRDGLIDQLQSLKELDDQMLHYYGDTLEKAKEELSGYTDSLDAAADKLKHFKKVQELSGNGTDYEATLAIIEGQKQVAQDSYDVAKKWYESRKKDQEEIAANLAKIDKTKNPKQYELEEQKLKDATKATEEAYQEMAGYRETYLELAQEEYKTTIDSIYDYADKKLSPDNMGLDQMIDSMSNLKTYADEFLTKTNQLYETNKMMRTLEQDIAKTSNAAAKQKLNNFAKEIQKAKEQNQLSNLELEILQAKYKQLQAQIALEEAQNAKNTVRLSRDSEGNYGYIYTANQDAIADAQQALDDADNDLYNIRLKAFNEYSEKVAQAKQKLLEELKSIDEDETLSTEEKEVRKTRISQQYYDIIQAYGDLANIAQQEDARIQQDAWAAAYSKQTLDATNWKTSIDQLLTDSKTVNENYHKDIDQMVKDTKEGHEKWRDAVGEVTTKSEELKNKIKDEVIPTLDDEIDEVGKATTKYGKHRDRIQEVIDKYSSLIKKIQSAIQELANYEDKANNININPPKTSSDGTSGNKDKDKTKDGDGIKDQPIKNPTTGSKKIYGYKIQSNGKVLASKLNAYSSANKAENAAKTSADKLFDNTPYAGWWSDKVYIINGTKKMTINAKITSSTVSGTTIGNYHVTYEGISYSAASKSALEKKVRAAYESKHKILALNPRNWKDQWNVLSGKVKFYDTGGYTGEWGNSGKLAMLHQKELVLNAEDTKNFLAGIEILRDVVQRIDLQAIYAGSSNISAASVGSSKSTLAQEVKIHAEFPNAVNHNEIEQAFDTLINRAAQYANRK